MRAPRRRAARLNDSHTLGDRRTGEGGGRGAVFVGFEPAVLDRETEPPDGESGRAGRAAQISERIGT